MITQIQVQNFKSYRYGVLPLAPLTVLIGANASGKSNIIEALRFLARIAEGARLSLLYNDDDSPFRGDTNNLGYRGAKNFQISCDVNTEKFEGWSHFEIDLGFDNDGDIQVTQEKITDPTSSSTLYQITSEPQGSSGDIFVEYKNFDPDCKNLQIVCSNEGVIFRQLLRLLRRYSSQPDRQETLGKINQIIENYARWLRDIVFLDPDPHAMRSYNDRTHDFLNQDGENLSGFLYNICQNLKVKAEILDFVKSLPEQNIEDLGFIETYCEGVMLQITETFGGISTTYDARTISDGTLRVLSIAAILFSAPEESIVVIEEIDNGIHPSRAEGLLKSIYNIARSRHLRVLISSHNPALLDALPDEAVPETVFCYRSPQDGSSQLIQLGDIPDYPELIAQGTVGHLMTKGLLERFVKNHPGSEQKKQKAMNWLESIREEMAVSG